MNTKFTFSGRNWPLFFIWLIFLDLRLSIHLPTLVHLHRDKFIRCFLLRFPRRWPVGRLGFVCFCVGGRWVDVWGPWVDESSEIFPESHPIIGEVTPWQKLKSRWVHGSMVGAFGSMNQTAAALEKFHFRHMSDLQMKKINRLKEFQHANNAQRHDN